MRWRKRQAWLNDTAAFSTEMLYPVNCTSCGREVGRSSSRDWGSAMCGLCFGYFDLLLGVLGSG